MMLTMLVKIPVIAGSRPLFQVAKKSPQRAVKMHQTKSKPPSLVSERNLLHKQI
jgi:hypothetical protein